MTWKVDIPSFLEDDYHFKPDIDEFIREALRKVHNIEDEVLTGAVVDLLRDRGYVIFEPGEVPPD